MKSIVVPDPEEISEAFENGFIDYEDYRALLEISSAGRLSREDSLFLLKFPDLLSGFSVNPQLEIDGGASGSSPPGKPVFSVARAQGFLIRHDQKLTEQTQFRRLGRLHAVAEGCRLYGEWEHGNDGVVTVGRRYIEYGIARAADTTVRLTVGNFNDRFGLGLVYGYHGQLFSKSDGREMEGFLFPRYGGSNGLRVIVGSDKKAARVVYDTDRNNEFAKRFMGGAIPIGIDAHTVTVAGGYGLLRSRTDHTATEAWYSSVSGEEKMDVVAIRYELAVAGRNGAASSALAAEGRIRRAKGSLILSGWRYDRDYPAWFSGGPSSRRSRTSSIDEIGLTWRNRYGGETGGTIRATQNIARRVSLHTAVGYAWRSENDNRAEGLVGITYEINAVYRAKLDCFWRRDSLYSEGLGQRRIQTELVRQQGAMRTRIVTGHRIDRKNNRNDFLLYAEQKIAGRYGVLTFTGKLDRFRLDDFKTQTVYMTVGHQAGLSARVASVVKYSYRYRRGSAAASYGQFRCDLVWTL
ncbi:MAG: hypothetical protein PHR28_07980 [candidate division Zixibacteria bacterium]|nr:hypothetical protein [candidate division Zixibacteria bacterium]